ncbi:uncharacterized protein LOC107269652 [Cephus cinctus]|uniref:Uncharacterized protein LOC107269652 n=1 Tax=Cephus cinctus TaxID=211228 RepID=A0AAJ7C0W7_CEPCN|nr:uncharacterized protein LOC107269652 [Cephus cinctus]
MEPALAVDLVAHSTILKEAKIEIGVLVGDDDSSTISANVKKVLWSMSKNHLELKKNAIIHLHRCFTYAVAQNKNDKDAMKETIKQIVDHSFNNHQRCGDWCNFERDKENYNHSMIPGGLKNLALYEDLSKFFNKLAENVDKFVTASSSQPNENLNAIIVSKAPKSRFYGLTASLHHRVALAIASKNLGNRCLIEVLLELKLTPGPNMNAYVDER